MHIRSILRTQYYLGDQEGAQDERVVNTENCN